MIARANIRPAAVAGLFYPADPAELRRNVEEYFARVETAPGPAPKALISPHAGYVYSGPIAASGYARLRANANLIRRVVLAGPSHRVPFEGLAGSSAEAFSTPLGDVRVDVEAVRELRKLPRVSVLDRAHRDEHSLEVQLPFLQVLLGAFSIVPFVIGDASSEEISEALDVLWGGVETVVVVSSDLSHYHPHDVARELDQETAAAINRLEPRGVRADQACGSIGINGLLLSARRHGLGACTVDLRTSGDTFGPRDRVVGYGAFAFS